VNALSSYTVYLCTRYRTVHLLGACRCGEWGGTRGGEWSSKWGGTEQLQDQGFHASPCQLLKTVSWRMKNCNTVLESLIAPPELDKVVTSMSFDRREQVVIAITINTKTNGSITCNTELESLIVSQQIDTVITSTSLDRRGQVVIAITINTKTNGSITCNTERESLIAAQQIAAAIR
jgi:hypothetical protein